MFCMQVPPNYDSLLGKLIVWAEDRPQAIARMKRALNECVISGVPTTSLYHTMILDLEDFKNGNVDTGFIQKHQEELSTPKMPPTKSVSPKANCSSAQGSLSSLVIMRDCLSSWMGQRGVFWLLAVLIASLGFRLVAVDDWPALQSSLWMSTLQIPEMVAAFKWQL